MRKAILIIFGLMIMQSCSNDKELLIIEYQKLYSIIKERKFEETYKVLDSQSQAYISFLADTTNWKFEKIKKIGKDKNLEFTTLEYYYYLKSVFKGKKINNLALLELFGVTEVPLFNWFKEPRILEERTKKEKGNFVVIAYDINEKMYISTKVSINKDNSGEYKLNIFPLFKMNESILKQQFKKYKRLKREKVGNINATELMIQFFEEKDKKEYQLEKIRVRQNN